MVSSRRLRRNENAARSNRVRLTRRVQGTPATPAFIANASGNGRHARGRKGSSNRRNSSRHVTRSLRRVLVTIIISRTELRLVRGSVLYVDCFYVFKVCRSSLSRVNMKVNRSSILLPLQNSNSANSANVDLADLCKDSSNVGLRVGGLSVRARRVTSNVHRVCVSARGLAVLMMLR